MIKNKFIKNLYQIISFSVVIFVFVFFLLLGFFESLRHGTNNGWLLMLVALFLVLLFFIIGFHWIFQKIEIDEQGIKVLLFRKLQKKILWESVESISLKNVMRNPAYVLQIRMSKNLNLDKRKSIEEAIRCYAPKTLTKQLDE